MYKSIVIHLHVILFTGTVSLVKELSFEQKKLLLRSYGYLLQTRTGVSSRFVNLNFLCL